MREKVKKRIYRRLRVAEGQIRGLQKMLQKNKTYREFIQQSSALRRALLGIEDAILENHLVPRVVDEIKKGKTAKPEKEILDVYRLSKKKR